MRGQRKSASGRLIRSGVAADTAPVKCSDKEVVPDVLADRYASREMVDLWSPRGKIVLEREFWIAVLRAQRALGVAVPAEVVEAYERVKGEIDLDRIRVRERESRHDVKARIDEFCALAGYQDIHKGLTSRDLTENVEQLQILRSLQRLRIKYVGCLHLLAGRVTEYKRLVIAGRTHNVPAQATTVGKRLAMFGGEMLCALRGLEDLLARYPLRGLKGPVGTQLDLLTLFGGDAGKVAALEVEVARTLGFGVTLAVVGQVYPRSLDFAVVSSLCELAAGPSSFAKTLRLMAGSELAAEGFSEGQVGSSAMPHKINSRSCERVNGLRTVLTGYLAMVGELAGDQWNEGDVSCSAVRRVALPGAMFAIDGLLETFATIVLEMEVFPGAVAAERERVAPFLATTTVLMEAVKRGVGREAAHEAIRGHAVAVARAMRAGEGRAGDLLSRLASDPRLGMTAAEIARAMEVDESSAGVAVAQADAFVAEVARLVASLPEASRFTPAEIL